MSSGQIVAAAGTGQNMTVRERKMRWQLWSRFVLQSTLLGLRGGILVSAIVFIVVFALLAVGSLLSAETTGAGEGDYIAFGFILVLVIILGAIIGVISGHIIGIVLATLTWTFFNPPLDEILYGSVLRVTGIALSGLAGGSVSVLVSGEGWLWPFIISLPYGWWASGRLAEWYGREVAKGGVA